jgi:hypothetical protein
VVASLDRPHNPQPTNHNHNHKLPHIYTKVHTHKLFTHHKEYLEAERGAIKTEFEAHERRTLLYFAYSEAFTEEQLAEFRKDEVFNHKYECYLRAKQVWEEE